MRNPLVGPPTVSDIEANGDGTIDHNTFVPGEQAEISDVAFPAETRQRRPLLTRVSDWTDFRLAGISGEVYTGTPMAKSAQTQDQRLAVFVDPGEAYLIPHWMEYDNNITRGRCLTVLTGTTWQWLSIYQSDPATGLPTTRIQHAGSAANSLIVGYNLRVPETGLYWTALSIWGEDSCNNWQAAVAMSPTGHFGGTPEQCLRITGLPFPNDITAANMPNDLSTFKFQASPDATGTALYPSRTGPVVFGLGDGL